MSADEFSKNEKTVLFSDAKSDNRVGSLTKEGNKRRELTRNKDNDNFQRRGFKSVLMNYEQQQQDGRTMDFVCPFCCENDSFLTGDRIITTIKTIKLMILPVYTADTRN